MHLCLPNKEKANEVLDSCDLKGLSRKPLVILWFLNKGRERVCNSIPASDSNTYFLLEFIYHNAECHMFYFLALLSGGMLI